MSQLSLTTLPDIPEVHPGDDVGQVIVDALISAEITPQPHDIFAIAQKIVSKSENRFVYLDDVVPSEKALELSAEIHKDPRILELILRDTDEISRMRPGVIVVRHKLGFVSANAGIDRSNVAQDERGERVLLLPENPDRSARQIRSKLKKQFGFAPTILITDSHGRPHRLGTVGVAIGVAGFPALIDKRGTEDRYGFKLQHTDIGIADELASAAGLLMGAAAEGTPVVLIRGLKLPVSDEGVGVLFRPKEHDLYR